MCLSEKSERFFDITCHTPSYADIIHVKEESTVTSSRTTRDRSKTTTQKPNDNNDGCSSLPLSLLLSMLSCLSCQKLKGAVVLTLDAIVNILESLLDVSR